MRLVGYWWNGVWGTSGDRSIRLYEHWDGWHVVARDDDREVRYRYTGREAEDEARRMVHQLMTRPPAHADRWKDLMRLPPSGQGRRR